MILKKFFEFQNIIFLLIVIFIFFLIRIKKSLDKDLLKSSIKIENAQIIGKRNEQEDSYSTLKSDNGVIAVLADGMGGMESGKKASTIAVNTFIEEFTKNYEIYPIDNFLRNTTYIANQKILNSAGDSRLGTTLISTVINKNKLYWTSVGDSHLYLYRDNELKLLNKKHVYANKLKEEFKAGNISRDEMFNNPRKDMLTSYLGYEEFHELDYSKTPFELKSKDKILICSDGVYRTLSELEIEKILDKKITPEKASKEIFESIKWKNIKNQDNASIILMEYL